MDIYGAFQLCSLGILAAPVTARLSRTYFDDPGRNMIFLYTGLILAGEQISNFQSANLPLYLTLSHRHA